MSEAPAKWTFLVRRVVWDVRWEVHAHKGKEACALSLDNGILARNSVVLAIDGEDDVGELVQRGTVHGVFPHNVGFGPNRGCQFGNLAAGTGNQRRPRVNNGRDGGAVGVGGGMVLARLDVSEGNLPVCGRNEFDVGEFVPFKLGGIVPAKGELAWGVVSQIKGEDGLINDVLRNGILKDGRSAVDADGRKAQSEDAVKLSKAVRHTQSAGVLYLPEPLSVDLEVIGQDDRVLRKVPGHAAGPVHDIKIRAVGLVCAGGFVIVLGLFSKERVAAMGAPYLRDPQIGRAGVEDDLERLGRVPDGDGSVVLRVGVILDYFGLLLQRRTSQVSGVRRRHLFVEERRPSQGHVQRSILTLQMRRDNLVVGALVEWNSRDSIRLLLQHDELLYLSLCRGGSWPELDRGQENGRNARTCSRVNRKILEVRHDKKTHHADLVSEAEGALLSNRSSSIPRSLSQFLLSLTGELHGRCPLTETVAPHRLDRCKPCSKEVTGPSKKAESGKTREKKLVSNE